MSKSRRIKTNAEEAVKENFNMETEDPIQQDPVQEEMVEGIKEIEQEQPEQKTLVMSIDAITLSAMRTRQAKQQAKRTGLDEVIASETLGQFQVDFWKQISDFPCELFLM